MTYKRLMNLVAKLYDITTSDHERTVIGLELADMMKRGKLRTIECHDGNSGETFDVVTLEIELEGEK